jgi:succinate-semialdehyde dehydrogenase/glutarate-semialdehyde dehydrogenase
VTTAYRRTDFSRSMLIGGTARTGGAGTFPVENPATGEVIAHVADGDAADATAAVKAAQGALPGWRATPARTRSEALSRAYELMMRDGAAPGGGARTMVTHRAVGVAALITPWTSLPPWPPARSPRRWRPAAPWYSNLPLRHR